VAEQSLFEQLAQQLQEARESGDVATQQNIERFIDENAESMEYDWRMHGRPSQFAPEGEWDIWLVCAGRGFGKTRTGAEWVREKALNNPGCRIALVGRTSTDVSRTMVHGESGIMSVHAPDEKPEHKISKGRLEWANGSIAEFFSSEAPSQLRGPQFHYAWGDETAAWLHTQDDSGLNAWDNLRFATRLGARPQILATTTPKRTPAVMELIEEHEADPEKVVITRGSTFDNTANLPENFISSVVGRYQGTNIGDQELMGLLLDPENGALWKQELIQRYRWFAENPWRRLPIRCVALDPSVAENPKDEAGIIVVGATGNRDLHKRHAYVLEDATVLGNPDIWAEKAVEMARKYHCDIVAEGTQGQALVARMIRSIDPKIKVHLVQTGKRGKIARAEPVVLPYQQGRVHHVGEFEELELQMTTYSAENSKKSPDRLDALVHGLTACLIAPPKGFGRGPISMSKSLRGRRLPTSGRGSGRTWREGMSK
jgi:phage terminase large subunit-like protein